MSDRKHIEAVLRWQAAHPEQVKVINKRYRKAHPEVREEAAKRYRDANREKVRAANRERRKRKPEMNRAHDRVRLAIKAGKLTRGRCEQESDDCRGQIQAHHDDYSKPLEVRWLCRRHHAEYHLELSRNTTGG